MISQSTMDQLHASHGLLVEVSHGLLDGEAMNLSRIGQNPNVRCPMVAQPSYEQSREVLGSLGTSLISVGAVVVLIIFLVYADIVRHILTRVPGKFKSNSIVAVSIYPIMSLVTYIAIIVPRFQLLCEACIMFAWMTGLYQVFCLFVAYCGGEAEVVRIVESGEVDIQIAPCCCWPCCCFPKLQLSKKSLKVPRLLILQLSLVQSIVYLCLLTMWSEEELMYQSYYLYFQPFAIPSIFASIWGMTMVLRMLAPYLRDHQMYGKYVSLQMVLLLTKTQGTIARVVIMIVQEPCTTDLSPSVLSYLICNGVFLLELIPMVLIARYFYLRPLPDAVITPADRAQHLHDIAGSVTNNNKETDKYTTNGFSKEGIDNVSYT